jgi:hypothetical protein
MKKVWLVVIFLFVAWVQTIRVAYHYKIEAERNENNYNAVLSGVRSYYRGKLKAYQVSPQVLTRAQAKALFSEEMQKLEKQLNLRRVSQIIKIESSTGGIVKLQMRDTIIRTYSQIVDTIAAKVFNYADSNIMFRGINIRDSIEVYYRCYPRIIIARSLEPRKGIWNKITIHPLRRYPVYTVLPADSSMQVTGFSVIEIN